MGRITENNTLKNCTGGGIITDGFDIHDGRWKESAPLYKFTVYMREHAIGSSSANVQIYVYDSPSIYIREINDEINKLQNDPLTANDFDLFRLFDRYIHNNIANTERFVSQYYTIEFS